jgi:two-component system, NtrC family, response regulator HupR/HoxA
MFKPFGTVLILSRATQEWRTGTTVLNDDHGLRVIAASSAEEAGEVLAGVHVDVAVAEDGQESHEGIAFLRRLQTSHPDIARLLVIGAKAALPHSATEVADLYQYLRKPVDPQQLALAVRRALEARELARRQRLLAREFDASPDWLEFGAAQGKPLPGESRNFEKLVYASEAMSALCDIAREAAATALPILIEGEPGTGKELLAHALHHNSERSGQAFVRQNCSGPTDPTLEAEFFGEGAVSRMRGGSLHGAEGGTLFLDEVCELSKPMQSALLSFLDKGQQGQGPDIRLIASSTRPLKAMAAAGKIRQDLYFRLRGIELQIPPLRERPEDIRVLAEFFAARYARENGRAILGISASALDKLTGYDFPGNVRELENEICRMAALAKDGAYLTTAIMSPGLLAACHKASAAEGLFALQGGSLKEKIESLEKHLVRDALARHKWNRSRVAEELGLSRVGLANKIRRYGLNEQAGGSA